MEVIKLITGIGIPLAGEILSMDLGTNITRRVKLPRRPDCATCAFAKASGDAERHT
jgi:hypothetical protein